MSTKVPFQWFFITSLAGMVVLLVMGTTSVSAQCENPQPSSCTTCHAQEDPVNEKGEWHIIHASKDICINCHGGNSSAMDKALAHENLMAHPLDDIYTDCHGCHPDYEERAYRFAPALGITPGSCATPTPIPASNISGKPPSGDIYLPSEGMSPTSSPQLFFVISAGLTVLVLLFLGLGWLERHQSRS